MNPNGKITEDGRYIKCRLRDGLGNDKIVSHHRVAAMHFVPNPDPSLYNEVNHIDGDRSNNHISNFEWTTHHENTLHGNLASRDGKSSKYKGVSRKKNRGDDTWVWSVYMNKEQHRKGGFKTEEEAFDDLMRFYRENKLSTKHLL